MQPADWLRHFVIGSSFVVVAPFFVGVRSLGLINNLSRYAFWAPLFFGGLNAVSATVAERHGVDLRTRLFWTSQISAALVIAFLMIARPYKFSPQRYRLQYLLVWLAHFVTWNLVIWGLELLFRGATAPAERFTR